MKYFRRHLRIRLPWNLEFQGALTLISGHHFLIQIILSVFILTVNICSTIFSHPSHNNINYNHIGQLRRQFCELTRTLCLNKSKSPISSWKIKLFAFYYRESERQMHIGNSLWFFLIWTGYSDALLPNTKIESI